MAETEFDEIAFRNQLIEAGLDAKAAADVAAKTKANRENRPALAASPKTTPRKQFTQPDEGPRPIANLLGELPSPPAKGEQDRPKPGEKEETVDFTSKAVPAWVQEVIEAHLAIEAEDARSAKSLGFMARALVIATMPYKDPKADVFKRKNGDFSLRIVAGYEGGIPFGIYPRLLMSWVTTEAAVSAEVQPEFQSR